MQNITYEEKDGLIWIGFGKNEKKSMTTFTRETLEDMKEAIKTVQANKTAKGLVFFSHKPGVFLAGVDVTVINSLKTEAEALRALAPLARGRVGGDGRDGVHPVRRRRERSHRLSALGQRPDDPRGKPPAWDIGHVGSPVPGRTSKALHRHHLRLPRDWLLGRLAA